MVIRPRQSGDDTDLWRVLKPMVRAGETYALDRDMSREQTLAYWCAPDHEVFVAEEDGRLIGTYFLTPNHQGGGNHVANCGFVTDTNFYGRGLASAMCSHSLDRARERGFDAMQFNFVVSTNVRAVELWQRLGFAIVGRLPGVFDHPKEGRVDAFVMHRKL